VTVPLESSLGTCQYQ